MRQIKQNKVEMETVIRLDKRGSSQPAIFFQDVQFSFKISLSTPDSPSSFSFLFFFQLGIIIMK